ncbi:MAG: hypothetical protein ACK4KV_18740 [Rhodocyclaceae bacterium]
MSHPLPSAHDTQPDAPHHTHPHHHAHAHPHDTPPARSVLTGGLLERLGVAAGAAGLLWLTIAWAMK